MSINSNSLSLIPYSAAESPLLSLTPEKAKIKVDLMTQIFSLLSFQDLGYLARTKKAYRYVMMNNNDNAVFTPAIAMRLARVVELSNREIDGEWKGNSTSSFQGYKSTLLRGVQKTEVEIFSACASLQVFRIYGLSVYQLKSIATALQTCPRLTHLKVQGSVHWIKDDELLEFLPSCEKVRALELGSSKSLTSESIVNLVWYCPNLTMLGLEDNNSLQDSDFEVLARWLPNLVSLKISRNENLTDAAVLPFTTTRDMVDLDVSCTKVTAATVESLAKRAGSLRSVGFFPSLPGSLSKAPWVTLFTNCGPLQKAELFGVGLTDEALSALAARSPGLEDLSIANNGALTYSSLRDIVRKCVSLNTLHMTGCYHATSSLTINSFHSLTKLKRLTIDTGGPLLGTSEAVDALCRAKPGLSYSGSYFGAPGSRVYI